VPGDSGLRSEGLNQGAWKSQANDFLAKNMGLCLNMLSIPVQWCLLRKGSRLFALLGKATTSGLESFSRDDISRAWALTAELGCLRLERLSGDEEVTGDHCFLPNPFSYDYGIIGADDSPELTRAVFGLLPSELEQLVTVLRRGSFPVLGYSRNSLKCSVSSCIIPGGWPHVVVSNMALYGNVVSMESFLRIVITSLPHGRLVLRFPNLHPVFQEMVKLLLVQRRGVPYTRELLELAPAHRLTAK
jgi:hypothetical protein